MSLQQKILGEKILADRIRLLRLLRYFYDDRRSSGKLNELEAQILHLKDEIENRKEIYSADLYPHGEDAASGMHSRSGKAARKHTPASLLFNKTEPEYDTPEDDATTESPDAEYSPEYYGQTASARDAAFTPGSKNDRFYHRAVNYIAEVFEKKSRDASGAASQGRTFSASRKKRLMVAAPLILLLIALLCFLIYKKRERLTDPGATGIPGAHVQVDSGSGGTGTTGAGTVSVSGESGETGTPVTNQVITVKRVNTEEKELLAKRNVTIRDIDIFNYANDVAVKNGYEKITYTGIRQKNPHWIYPGNLFIMLDGEKVVVQSGDTLWDLAHAKLEKMNADFYKVIAELEQADTSDKNKIRELIDRADSFAYIPQQKKIIAAYRSKISNE